MAARLKRSPPHELSDKTELAQVRISKEAMAKLKAMADAEALPVASYHRRLLYRHLGLIE